jgi:hypothetical protein
MAIQLLQITPEELRESILEGVKKELQELKQNFQPKEPSEFLTRQEVADWLKVDISTVHNWTVKGTLTKHLIEGKVLYKRAEVESSLIKS